MKLEEFNYDLPKELIAQEPAEPRDSCRLMMLDKNTGEWEHHGFREPAISSHRGAPASRVAIESGSKGH